MSERDFFETGADLYDRGLKMSKNVFKQCLNWLLFTALIVVTLILTFIQLGLTNRITEVVIVNTVYIFITGTTALLVFFPQGEQNEKIKNESFKLNLELWKNKSDIVRKGGKLAAFNQFCKNKTVELRDNIKETFILNAGIDLSVYKEIYANKTIKDIKKNKTLSQQQKHWLIKAKKNIKVRPISAISVLSGAELAPGKAVGQKHISAKSQILIYRVINTILMSIVFGTLTFNPIDAVGWSLIGLCALRLLAIVTSSVMGFYGGISKIRADNSDNKAKILFINEFLEKEGIKD